MLPSEMRARVRFLGLVPRRQLPYFYSRAGVVVGPSLSEALRADGARVDELWDPSHRQQPRRSC